MKRRFLIGLILFSIFCAVLLSTGVLFSPFLPFLERTASKAVSCRVSIERALISWKGVVVLKNVSVRSTEGPLVHVREIRFRPRWTKLIKRRLALSHVTIIEPTVSGDPAWFRSAGGSEKDLSKGLGSVKKLKIIRGRWIFPANPKRIIGPVDLLCSFHDQTVRMESLILRIEKGSLAGSGAVSLKSGAFDLKCDTRNFRLDLLGQDWFSLPAVGAIRHDGKWRAQGNGRQWQIQAEGYLTRGDPPGKVKIPLSCIARFTGAKGEITATSASALAMAEGVASIDTNRRWVESRFKITVDSLAHFSEFWPKEGPIDGSLVLDGSLSGRWGSPQMVLHAVGRSLRYGPVRVDHLDAQLKRERDPLSLSVSISSLTWTTDTGKTGYCSSAHGVWTGDVDQGDLRMEISFRNAILHGQGPAVRRAKGVYWRWDTLKAGPDWETAPGGELAVRSTGFIEVQKLRFIRAGGNFNVHRLAWGDGTVALDISAENFPFHFPPFAMDNDADFSGLLSGNIQLSGPLGNPRGEFDIRASSVVAAGFPSSQIRAVGHVEESLVEVKDARVEGPSFPVIRARGSVPWAWVISKDSPREMDVSVQAGPLDPAELLGPMSAVETKTGGSLELEGRVTGRPGAWQAQGNLSAHLPSVRIPSLGIDAREARVMVELKNQRLLIRQAEAKLGKGKLQVSGESDGSALHFDIRGDSLMLRARRRLEIKTGLHLDLRGTWKAPVLSGGIPVSEATYEPKAKGKGETRDEKDSTRFAYWDRLKVDLRTHWKNDVWYRDGLTKIETQANLQIKKEHGQKALAIEGFMTLLRGSYDAYGRDFVIKSGAVTFVPSEEMDPLLNIQAEHKMPQALVELDVSGTARKPELRFHSTPPMTEPDILALLALGKVPGQSASQPNDPRQPSAAMDLAADVVSDYLTRGVRSSGMNILDLDVLRVSPTDKGKEWTVGRYWGSKLFLSYSYNPEDSASQVLKAEYTFLPQWTLVGQSGSRSDDYLDLVFRLPIKDRRKKEKKTN